MPERLFGIIGKSLKHTFSPAYFSEKFKKEGISDCDYQIFEIEKASEISSLFENPKLLGVNVTIPFKEEVISYLNDLDVSARKVGAVNVVKKIDNSLVGFNSDYFGFKESLLSWYKPKKGEAALILGTGGASKAVAAVLLDKEIPFRKVSRSKSDDIVTYDDLKTEGLSNYRLIINTTPLGMFPETSSKPDLLYNSISKEHYFYDLVYNPPETTFLSEAKKYGAEIKNGYEMLVLQAERSWGIWNS
ncbi:MAG: shikimate dehydrogenase [Bacteroidota bacterium]